MNTFFLASYILLWIVVLIQGIVFIEVLRQLGSVKLGHSSGQQLEPLDKTLPLGTEFSSFSGEWADTKEPIHDLRSDAPVNVVLLLSTHCPPCRLIAENASRLDSEIAVTFFVHAPVGSQKPELVSICGGILRSCLAPGNKKTAV